EPDPLHLVGDPLPRSFAVLCAGTASLERIVGNRLIASREIGRVDVGRGVGMARIFGLGSAGAKAQRQRSEREKFALHTERLRTREGPKSISVPSRVNSARRQTRPP